MKKKYIHPETELLQTSVQSMLALSLKRDGVQADPEAEVLVKDNDWDNIWEDEE